ncbi:retrovirus-related pol polyprotein from transposon TNT 1-94 [Tanacetum coccineum]|uniref:Retrovirus-related pol polyprotein from transposon TNT 1-94 n=1 Tax=Tanacetum coccineum TaxID=301880 RepID=A0ABQ4X1E0_9ASTR
MTGNRSVAHELCRNFLELQFDWGNGNIARIMGYGDYQLGNVTIFRVYYVEGLGHKLFSVSQFCNADLEVAFRKNTCFIPCALGKSKKSSHQPKAEDTNQEKLYLLHMDLCGLMRVASINWKRQNRTLVEVARTMLIFSKALLFLWAEAINTACYTQNRSIIHRRYNKTPYELMQDKKSDISFFYVFGALCYPTNDNYDLGKLDAKADIGPGLHFMTPATSSSGLVPNTISQQPCIPPNRDDWDYLFQPMFDEYFTPPVIIVPLVLEAATLRTMVLVDSPVSTSIDQDAPSSITPSTQE